MKNTTKIVTGKALPAVNSLINVLVVNTDASFGSTQCWDGAKEAVQFATEKVRNGLDVTNPWDRRVLQVLCYVWSLDTTYQYTAEEILAGKI